MLLKNITSQLRDHTSCISPTIIRQKHENQPSKNRKKRLQLMHVYKKLDSLVSMSIFGYKLKLEDCNLFYIFYFTQKCIMVPSQNSFPTLEFIHLQNCLCSPQFLLDCFNLTDNLHKANRKLKWLCFDKSVSIK